MITFFEAKLTAVNGCLSSVNLIMYNEHGQETGRHTLQSESAKAAAWAFVEVMVLEMNEANAVFLPADMGQGVVIEG